MPSALALMLANPTLRSLAQYGTRPHLSTSRLRSPALASYRTTGRGSVGATFQLGGKFGVGRCGGIEKTSVISLTSEERRARPHMLRSKRHLRTGRSSRAIVEGTDEEHYGSELEADDNGG